MGGSELIKVPFNRFFHRDEEIEFAVRALKSGVTAGNGPLGKQVETLLSQRLDNAPTLLFSSCTHALEAAALLLDLQPGDEVILASYNFVSSANAFALRGAQLRWAEISPTSLCLSLENIERAIGPRTKAVCVVNYNGAGQELAAIREFLDERGIWLVEDNAHGFGGEASGKPLGTFGHVSVTSFHQTKNISSGEGGALTLNARELLPRAEIIRDKGTDRQEMTRGRTDKYLWQNLGSSWVLSDVLAGLLIPQLEKLDQILEGRRSIWWRYWNELTRWAERYEVQIPPDPMELENTGHVFWMILPSQGARDRLIRHLALNGVNAPFHYQSLHLSPYALSRSWPGAFLPESDRASGQLIRLPLFRGLTPDQQSKVIEHVLEFTST